MCVGRRGEEKDRLVDRHTKDRPVLLSVGLSAA